MGKEFVDRFTLLHFATGVIAYHWGMGEKVFVFAHISFELLENTKTGIKIINQIPYWPGGKQFADSPLNMVGDTAAAWVGWKVANYLNQ